MTATLLEVFRILKEKEERAKNERKARESIKKDTEARFRDMEEKLDRMNAFSDLSRSQRFEEMEKSDEIEKELEELRKKAGMK